MRWRGCLVALSLSAVRGGEGERRAAMRSWVLTPLAGGCGAAFPRSSGHNGGGLWVLVAASPPLA
jgi:hypothetical protein